jgi:L-lactate utilization protein LutB
MDTPMDQYWMIRLADVSKTLQSNNFETYIAENAAAAKKIVLEEIIPKTGAKSMAWGGSMTFTATGLYEALKKVKGMKVLDPYDKTLSREESLECRRQSLLVDLFITGSNAITETGMLVNLDMIGNRVAALTFGPKHVIVLVGRNKVVPDLEEAMIRVKNIAAPANTMRLGMNTPCAKTSYCEECKSKDRICNSWAITEKSFPKGRIRVVLINEDLGL